MGPSAISHNTMDAVPEPPPGASARAWRPPLVAASAALLLLYRPLGKVLGVRHLTEGGDLGLGLLAPVLALWLAWGRRDVLARMPLAPGREGWWLIAAGGTLAWAGHRLDIILPLAWSLPLILAGTLWLLCGREWAASLWFPLLVLAAAAPLPAEAAKAVTFPLQSMVARLADLVLTLAGIPSVRDGVLIHFPGGAVQVAEGCSGWRSASACFWAFLLLAYQRRPHDWRSWAATLPLLLPLSVAANLLRVLVVAAALARGGGWAVAWPWHHLLGLLCFLPLAWLLLQSLPSVPGGDDEQPQAEGTTTSCHLPRAPAASPGARGAAAMPSDAWRVAVALWAVWGIGRWGDAGVRPTPEPPAAAGVPARLGEWRRVQIMRPARTAQGDWQTAGTYRNASGTTGRVVLHAPLGVRARPLRVVNCWLKEGYELVSLERGTLRIAGRGAPIGLATVTRGRERASVAFGHLSMHGSTPGDLDARLRRMGELLIRGEAGPWVTVTASAADAHAACDLQSELIRHARRAWRLE